MILCMREFLYVSQLDIEYSFMLSSFRAEKYVIIIEYLFKKILMHIGHLFLKVNINLFNLKQ